jgi:phosphoribosylamine--glycine ligase
MGAYSPAPVVTPEVYERIMTSVIRPTVEGMAEEGAPFRGFLYAGVMINDQGIPYVLEFNCRMGDPETQPIMQRLNSDITELCLAACQGRLDHVSTQWDERISLGVVMVSGGYPDTYAKGFAIEGLDQPDIDDVKVFHAGTRQDEQGNVVNSGGRVLCVCALGSTTAEAQQKAYHRARQIHWQDCAYRTDIGYRAIARENNR